MYMGNEKGNDVSFFQHDAKLWHLCVDTRQFLFNGFLGDVFTLLSSFKKPCSGPFANMPFSASILPC